MPLTMSVACIDLILRKVNEVSVSIEAEVFRIDIKNQVRCISIRKTVSDLSSASLGSHLALDRICLFRGGHTSRSGSS